VRFGPGARLGTYEIVALLGAGGMGEVYRATDTRLGRDVALKALRADTSAHRDRLDRFRREAKTLAALDHPNIVTVFSVEQVGGVDFLTMQLVEGLSLDRLIPRDGLAVDRILAIATALADALAAAHERGIVHRDLKPSNVMVTREGRVKVLDFGLAKATEGVVEAGHTVVETRDGVVMGTLPYMSPEQVTGRAVDHRSDIFSLGVLIYEMVTGRRPFSGASSAELTSSILRDTPTPPDETRFDLPVDLLRIVRRCLEKTVTVRMQTARDVYNELRDLTRQSASGTAALSTARHLSVPRQGGVNSEEGSWIAVLPFRCRGAGTNVEALAEELTEAVATGLSRCADLRVFARSATSRYADEGVDVRGVGEQLGARYVMEGSVRHVDDVLRVGVQLVDAATGGQLWAETYTRPFRAAALFELSDEIVPHIVAAVTGVHAGAATTTTETPRPTRTTVGREGERQELRTAFKAARGGRGSIVCLTGEPGIGKTTVVEETLDDVAAAGAWTIARGRCSERLAGTEAYLPLLEALEGLVRNDDAIGQSMRELAPTWFAQVAPSAGRPPESSTLSAELRTASQERMKRELGVFVHQVSQATPLVLFFDDLHWADVSTVDMLSYLAAKLENQRVLIIVTYRPSDMLLARHPFLQIKPDLQARGILREIALGFLSIDDIAQYVALEFPGHRFDAAFASLIHEKTEGSPLFMADLVHYLRDCGAIAPQSGAWTMKQTLEDIASELPESVRGMIERKIAQLADDDRALLMAASVQGAQFDSAVVAQVLSLEPAGVEDRLETLERVHAFVTAIGEAEFPNRTLTLRYRFVHVLYQNALYASLRPTRRAALSAAVADVLVRGYGKQKTAIASQLAALYLAARDYVAAVEHYLLAAQHATRIFAHAEATTLAERGLELVDKLPEAERARHELRLRFRQGSSLMVLKGYGAPEVLDIHVRMHALAQQLGDEAQLLRAELGLSIVHVVRAEYAQAYALAGDALRRADAAHDLPMSVQACFCLGLCSEYRGNLAQARREFEQSIGTYDPGQHASIALYGAILNRAHLGRTIIMLGDHDAGRALLDEAMSAAEANRHPVGLVNTLTVLAFVDVLYRRMAEVLTTTDRMIALSDEHGYPYYRAIALVLRGLAMTIGTGDAAGIETMREGLAAHRAAETWQNHATYLILLAEALGETGRVDQALDSLDDAEAAISHSDERYYEPELHHLRGRLLLKRSAAASAEAEACLLRAIDIGRRQGARPWELRAALSLAKTWADQGRQDEAVPLLAEIYGRFSEGFDTPDLVEAKALLQRLRTE
jgi:serine/threonine protein kinase/predicted ATPase